MAVLDILKLLLSKDTKDTVSKAIGILRKSPEWKTDLYTREYKFKGQGDLHKIELLLRFYMHLLQEKNWSESSTYTIEFACNELVKNAFLYSNNNLVRIKLSISASSLYFMFSIEDNGPGFDLEEQLAKKASNPHGLNYVKKIADQLYQKNLNTVSASFTKHKGQCTTYSKDKIFLIKLSGRINSISCPKIKEEILSGISVIEKDQGILLDISDSETFDSTGLSLLMAVRKISHRNAIPFSTVQPNKSYVMELFKVSQLDPLMNFFTSIDEAYQYIISHTNQ
jgi:anti-anti-sigma factor